MCFQAEKRQMLLKLLFFQVVQRTDGTKTKIAALYLSVSEVSIQKRRELQNLVKWPSQRSFQQAFFVP